MKINRVLIVHPHLTIFGGAEILLSQFTKKLLDLSISVKLATLSLSKESEKRFDHRIEFILPKKTQQYKLRSTGLLAALGTIPEAIRLNSLINPTIPSIDIINVHNFPATWAINKKINKPVIWMCNEPPALWNNTNPSWILKSMVSIGEQIDKKRIRKNIDKIVVSDDVNFKRVARIYSVEPEIINYGVDYSFFSKKVLSNLREEYCLQDSLILLHTGVFSPQKNQMQSARLLNEIKNIVPNIKLIYAGQGGNNYEENVRQYIKDHSLQNRTLFLGHVDREKMRELYQETDIALFPTKAQGGWLSPFEAISAGTPIVVSQELTASSIIRQNDLGNVTNDFVPATVEIVSDIKKTKQKVESAQQWVQDHLSWDKYTERMIEIFNMLR